MVLNAEHRHPSLIVRAIQVNRHLKLASQLSLQLGMSMVSSNSPICPRWPHHLPATSWYYNLETRGNYAITSSYSSLAKSADRASTRQRLIVKNCRCCILRGHVSQTFGAFKVNSAETKEILGWHLLESCEYPLIAAAWTTGSLACIAKTKSLPQPWQKT